MLVLQKHYSRLQEVKGQVLLGPWSCRDIIDHIPDTPCMAYLHTLTPEAIPM